MERSCGVGPRRRHPCNLLAVDGRLGAVIDFGGCAVGDPACDLAVAWIFFSGLVGESSCPRSTWTTRPGPAAAVGLCGKR